MAKMTLAQLEQAVKTALFRAELTKQAQQVMCTKLGLDWEAVCAKAMARMETEQRVQEQMDKEKAAKADAKGNGDA